MNVVLPRTIAVPRELHGRRVVLRPFEPEDGPAVHEAIEETRAILETQWPDVQKEVERTTDWCAAARLLGPALGVGAGVRRRERGGAGAVRVRGPRREPRRDPVRAENTNSARVAERAGFPLEARLKREKARKDGTLCDTLVFAALREDFARLLPTWSRHFS